MLLTQQQFHGRQVRQVMLFKALTNQSVAQYPSTPDVSRIVRSLSVLHSLPAAEVIRLYTPFVALNSRRLAAALEERSASIETELSGFLLSSFDAFFPILPNDLTLALKFRGPVALPTLGLCIGGESETIHSIKITSRSSIAIVSDSQSCEIRLDAIPAKFKINDLPLRHHPQAKSFAAASPLVFERAYLNQISTDITSIVAIRDLSDDALGLLMAAGPLHLTTIQRIMRWIVPINFDDQSVHRSFTSPLLTGVVFVSANTTSVGMAEAIVHEIAHSELNMLMEVEDLFTGSTEALYYSPWRSDPRPIAGLFHALYVFSKVLQFLEKLAKVRPQMREGVLSRGRMIAHRLMIGISQIQSDRLYESAQRLQSDVLQAARSFLKTYNPAETGPPKELTDHLSDWLSRHPSLASPFLESTLCLKY